MNEDLKQKIHNVLLITRKRCLSKGQHLKCVNEIMNIVDKEVCILSNIKAEVINTLNNIKLKEVDK